MSRETEWGRRTRAEWADSAEGRHRGEAERPLALWSNVDSRRLTGSVMATLAESRPLGPTVASLPNVTATTLSLSQHFHVFSLTSLSDVSIDWSMLHALLFLTPSYSP